MIRVALILMTLAGGAVACDLPERDMSMRGATWTSGASEWRVEMIGRTDRYGHAIMGRLADSTGLLVERKGPGEPECPRHLELPASQVIEDIAPRWADVTGDGTPEVLTVVSSQTRGARLAIFDADLKPLAMGPEIGRRFRWLAIIGVGDFDGNGRPDIAYVETPHLGKTLRIWSLRDGALVEIGRTSGLTNHRIGDETNTSAVAFCSDGPDRVVLADARWDRVVTAWIDDGEVVTEVVGPFDGPASIAAAAHCDG